MSGDPLLHLPDARPQQGTSSPALLKVMPMRDMTHPEKWLGPYTP